MILWRNPDISFLTLILFVPSTCPETLPTSWSNTNHVACKPGNLALGNWMIPRCNYIDHCLQSIYQDISVYGIMWETCRTHLQICQIQCNAVITAKFSQNTHHSSPFRATYGMSFVDSISDLYSAPPLLCIQYRVLLDHAITALICVSRLLPCGLRMYIVCMENRIIYFYLNLNALVLRCGRIYHKQSQRCIVPIWWWS